MKWEGEEVDSAYPEHREHVLRDFMFNNYVALVVLSCDHKACSIRGDLQRQHLGLYVAMAPGVVRKLYVSRVWPLPDFAGGARRKAAHVSSQVREMQCIWLDIVPNLEIWTRGAWYPKSREDKKSNASFVCLM